MKILAYVALLPSSAFVRQAKFSTQASCCLVTFTVIIEDALITQARSYRHRYEWAAEQAYKDSTRPPLAV
jgi:hypothetical protein